MSAAPLLFILSLVLGAGWFIEYRERLAAEYRFEALMNYANELESRERGYIELPSERSIAIQPALSVIKGGYVE